MALTTCKDCGEPVSSRADECRHCGRLMRWGTLDEAVGMPLLLAILMLFFQFHL
jgi:hypothetical protein